MKRLFFSERYLKVLILLTKSSIVTADKLFNTESRDDIAAENKATSVSPTIPIGKLSIRKIGTAKLKLGVPSCFGRLEIKSALIFSSLWMNPQLFHKIQEITQIVDLVKSNETSYEDVR